MQSNFLTEKKNDLKAGEFCVIGDFSENYSFLVQEAAQIFHWNNTQATIHPWVFYYSKNSFIKHSSFTIISESNNHNVVSVHLFLEYLVAHLKTVFDNDNVKKIFTFQTVVLVNIKTVRLFLIFATIKMILE